MANTSAKEALKRDVEDMVGSPEFQDQKEEFGKITHKYAKRSGKTKDQGWDILKNKVIEILPAYLSDGIIACSLEKIAEEEQCRKAMDTGKQQLIISPDTGFPVVKIPAFFPYLDFILRAGPIDICHMRTKFKVEGTLSLTNVTLQFNRKRITRISGSALVDAKISLCKGEIPIKLHEFKRDLLLDSAE